MREHAGRVAVGGMGVQARADTAGRGASEGPLVFVIRDDYYGRYGNHIPYLSDIITPLSKGH